MLLTLSLPLRDASSIELMRESVVPDFERIERMIAEETRAA